MTFLEDAGPKDLQKDPAIVLIGSTLHTVPPEE